MRSALARMLAALAVASAMTGVGAGQAAEASTTHAAAQPPAKTFPAILNGRTKLVPGDSGPVVRAVQRHLRAAGIPVNLNGRSDTSTYDAVAHLQEKFLLIPVGNVNASTLRVLLRITAPGTAMPKACRKADYALCVSKTQRVVRVVRDGKVVRTLDARFGADGFRTRNGTHRVIRKVRDEYSTRYNARMPYSLYFFGGQAVHYSDGFAADGYSGASHGCVNVRDLKAIARVFKQTPIGTPVVIYGRDRG